MSSASASVKDSLVRAPGLASTGGRQRRLAVQACARGHPAVTPSSWAASEPLKEGGVGVVFSSAVTASLPRCPLHLRVPCHVRWAHSDALHPLRHSDWDKSKKAQGRGRGEAVPSNLP